MHASGRRGGGHCLPVAADRAGAAGAGGARWRRWRVLALVRMLITANNFQLTRRAPAPHRASIRGGLARRALRLFFGEVCMASMLQTSWFNAAHRRANHLDCRHSPACLPVLLVHGYGCNSGYWSAI
jgi:pimeloyl-ACP methyl ester carboxylesterase